MKRILSLMLCLTVLFGCQKNLNETIPVPGTPVPLVSPVSGSVAGKIVNENNVGVANVAVSIQGTNVITDADGFFNSSTLTLDKFMSYASVEVPGYYKGYRSFCANASKNYILIKLIKKTVAGTFSSSSAGSVTLSNGTALSFSANSIVDKATGAAYTGNVKVFATYIDPTATDIASIMPGSLIGINDNKLFALRSTGMLAVELESDGGTPLQLASGKPATIKLPIPASITNAPSTIDTWSLDDKGVWKKEGSATKNGSAYEFEATHFSFWNCDVPIQAIYLTVHLQDTGLNSINHAEVDLQSSTTWGTRSGFTDAMGNVSGIVPANESMTLKVWPQVYSCMQTMYSQQVGPYSADAIETVTVQISPNNSYSISGMATGCNAIPITNGMAVLYYGSWIQEFLPITNGTFYKAFTGCAGFGNIKVNIIDYSTNQQSGLVSIPVSGNTINAGTINVCTTPPPPPPPPGDSSYIYYNVDSTQNFNFTSINGSLSIQFTNTGAHIMTYANQNENLSFSTLGANQGVFPINPDSTVTLNGMFGNAIQSSQVNFTSFGGPGSYVDGNFHMVFRILGTVINSTVTGVFHIKRL